MQENQSSSAISDHLKWLSALRLEQALSLRFVEISDVGVNLRELLSGTDLL
jgi:hypothetical protein